MPTPAIRSRSIRVSEIGCSPTRMPRTLFWGCIIAFITAASASVVGLVVAPSTALGVATVLTYAAWAVSILAVGAWVTFPDLFRRNR